LQSQTYVLFAKCTGGGSQESRAFLLHECLLRAVLGKGRAIGKTDHRKSPKKKGATNPLCLQSLLLRAFLASPCHARRAGPPPWTRRSNARSGRGLELAQRLGRGRKRSDSLIDPGIVARGSGFGGLAAAIRLGARGYRVTVLDAPPALDLGDNPDSYRTTVASVGASHVIAPDLYLGACVDGEADGQDSPDASGDDSATGTPVAGTCAANDDEDGVEFLAPELVPGDTAEIRVSASGICYLNAWIDFGQDGGFGEPGDQVTVDLPLTGGGVTDLLSIPIPVGIPPGDSFARFRCSSQRGVTASGAAPDGEVEDYPVLVSVVTIPDLGDAPVGFPTTLAEDGARHFQDGITYLGSCVDVESDGQPSSNATGDDLSASDPGSVIGTCADGDDEDGVVLTSTLVPSLTATLEVTASNVCVLSAWMDFNGDGDWSTPGDDLFPGGQTLTAGVNPLTIEVPDTATLGAEVAARFRCTTTGPLGFTGQADNGEVEDYLFVVSGPDMALEKVVDGEFNRAAGRGQYRLTVDNRGTLATQGPVTVEDVLPAGLTPLGASGEGWDCQIAGQTVTCVNDTVVEPGGMLPEILLEVAIAADAPARIDNLATVATPLDAQQVNDEDIAVTAVFTRMAPPRGYKTVDMQRFPELTWRMVWINPDNVLATGVRISDPIPPGNEFVAVNCTVDGVSVQDACRFEPATADAPDGRVVFEGAIGPDPGATADTPLEETANEVVIELTTRYMAWDGQPFNNQALAFWDEDDDGVVDEDETVSTDDPSTPEDGDPTRVQPRPPLNIPTLSTLAMVVLGMLLLLVALAGERRRRV